MALEGKNRDNENKKLDNIGSPMMVKNGRALWKDHGEELYFSWHLHLRVVVFKSLKILIWINKYYYMHLFSWKTRPKVKKMLDILSSSKLRYLIKVEARSCSSISNNQSFLCPMKTYVADSLTHMKYGTRTNGILKKCAKWLQ